MKLKLQALTLVWLLSTTLGMRTKEALFLKPEIILHELTYKFDFSVENEGYFTTPPLSLSFPFPLSLLLPLPQVVLLIQIFPKDKTEFKLFSKGRDIIREKLPTSLIRCFVDEKENFIKITILNPYDEVSNNTIREALNGPILPVLPKPQVYRAKQTKNNKYIVRLHVETNLEAFVNDQELKILDPIRKIKLMKKMVKLLKEFVTAKYNVTDLELGDFGINVEGSKKVSEVEIPKFDSQVKIYFLSYNKLEVKQIIDSDYEKKLVKQLGSLFYKLFATSIDANYEGKDDSSNRNLLETRVNSKKAKEMLMKIYSNITSSFKEVEDDLDIVEYEAKQAQQIFNLSTATGLVSAQVQNVYGNLKQPNPQPNQQVHQPNPQPNPQVHQPNPQHNQQVHQSNPQVHQPNPQVSSQKKNIEPQQPSNGSNIIKQTLGNLLENVVGILGK